MASFLSSPQSLTRLVLCAVILCVTGMALCEPARAADTGTPVLVELFTSEGCSDCPPADTLLEKLDKEQPIAGMHLIVLSEHVTYWDRQGWRDPFSMDQMTERQQAYAARFGLNDVYTPQMVVDGTAQFVGSNAQALAGALQAASERPKQPLSIENARWVQATVEFSVRGAVKPGERLVAVLAADATHTEVTRRECRPHVAPCGGGACNEGLQGRCDGWTAVETGRERLARRASAPGRVCRGCEYRSCPGRGGGDVDAVNI